MPDLRAELVRLAVVSAAAPALAAAALFALPSAEALPLRLTAAVLPLAGAAYFVWRAGRLLRMRLSGPAASFRKALQDGAEGFVDVDGDMPAEMADADAELVSCYGGYVEVSRMLLRHVNSLEDGFEEERLAKLRLEKLNAAYEKFVPKPFIGFLRKESVMEVRLGDHVHAEMTILISDIRSYTALSEQLTPEENFGLLNSYLAVMEPAVQAHGGFIDKYMGDAIMALFPGKPDDALDAAFDMLARLDLYNEGRKRAGAKPLAIGIGVNTGQVMLGIVGGENRMEGTVISDAVNMASRIEDLNKPYGTTLLLSEHTAARLVYPERYRLQPVDRVTVKGKTQPVLIYEAGPAQGGDRA